MFWSYESYQEFQSPQNIFCVPVIVFAWWANNNGELACDITDKTSEKSTVSCSVRNCLSWKTFCHTFMRLLKGRTEQLLMLRTTLFDDRRFRSNQKVSDEKTGNMQNLSSVKQTFLVSSSITEMKSYNRHPHHPPDMLESFSSKLILIASCRWMKKFSIHSTENVSFVCLLTTLQSHYCETLFPPRQICQLLKAFN